MNTNPAENRGLSLRLTKAEAECTDVQVIDRLDRLRIEKGWSSRDVGRYAGLSLGTWTRIYTRKACTLDSLVRVSTALGQKVIVKSEEPENDSRFCETKI